MILTEKGETTIKEKGSRFISRAIPVQIREQASAELALLKKREYDATHHCWAYYIGPAGDIFRSSDDGEPSGTAGIPILRQIESAGLTDTLVVVTRYYGGTKLGTGGLIRAYGAAASAVLKSVRTKRVTRRVSIRVSFDYADTSPAMHTIQLFDSRIGETTYGDQTVLEVLVKRSEGEAFKQAFINALSARGKILI